MIFNSTWQILKSHWWNILVWYLWIYLGDSWILGFLKSFVWIVVFVWALIHMYHSWKKNCKITIPFIACAVSNFILVMRKMITKVWKGVLWKLVGEIYSMDCMRMSVLACLRIFGMCVHACRGIFSISLACSTFIVKLVWHR